MAASLGDSWLSQPVKKRLVGWCKMATSLGAGSVESQPVKRRLGGWCEMVTSLGPVSC
jgi:hypothetical protein